MTKKSKFSIGQSIVYLLLILWSITTVYPIIWVLQNSFKAKDKILANSFSLPLGELFTMANYRKAFTNLNIVSAYKNSIFISTMVALFVILLAGMAAMPFPAISFSVLRFFIPWSLQV